MAAEARVRPRASELHTVQRRAGAGCAAPGDKVVITAGVPMGTPGSTNVLRVERIPGTP